MTLFPVIHYSFFMGGPKALNFNLVIMRLKSRNIMTLFSKIIIYLFFDRWP